MKIFVTPQKIKFFGISAMLLASITSCNEEAINDLSQQEIDLQTIETIVEKTNELYLTSEVTGGDENTPLTVENDGLIDEYLVDSVVLEPEQPHHRNRFVRCLKSADLTTEQIPQVRRSVKAFQMRNKIIIMQQRIAVVELTNAKEQRRRFYLAQLHGGEITGTEFAAKMKALRQSYVAALLEIKKSRATEFAPSFRLLLKNLNEILDSSQWQIFTDCMKGANN